MAKEFNHYDNIDYEVIDVSKHFLLLKFKECAEYASLPAEILGYAGVAISLFSATFLSEITRGFLGISGETVQAIFFIGGLGTSIMAVYKMIAWHKVRNQYTPTAIVESLSRPKEIKITALLPAPVEQPSLSKNIKNRKKVSTQDITFNNKTS